MRRIKLGWIFGIAIFALIVVSMRGQVEDAPFEIEESFQRICAINWTRQPKLEESFPVAEQSTVNENCACLTQAMKYNRATDREFSVLIQWLTTTENYDREKYYQLANYTSKDRFKKSLQQCADGEIETVMNKAL